MNYRIPKIEEFVEGFEFEVYMKSGGGSFGFMDFSKPETQNNFSEQVAVNRQPTIEDWVKYTVPKITLSLEWCFNFSVKYYLNEQKIRTKA